MHEDLFAQAEMLAKVDAKRPKQVNLRRPRNERFKRSEVQMLIEQAKDRTAKFAALAMSDDKRFFLACLWAWKELTNR